MSTTPGLSRGAQLLAEWRGKARQTEASKLLGLDPVTYTRFEHGIRKPKAAISFLIEERTLGKVPAKSWFEEPKPEQKSERKARKAS